MADFASWLGSGIGTIGSDIGSGLSSIGNWLGGGGGAAATGAPSASDLLSSPSFASGGVTISPLSGAGALDASGAMNLGGTLSNIGAGGPFTPAASGPGSFGFSLSPGAGGVLFDGGAALPLAGTAPSNTFASQLLGLGGGGNATAAPISIGGTSSLPAAAAGAGSTAPSGILSDLPSLKSVLPFLGLGVSALLRPSLPGGVGQAAGTAQQQQAIAGQEAANAAPLSAQAAGLINSATTGQLPPGAQAVLDQAEQAAKADAASKFAGMGLTGSSSEGSALSSIDLQRAAQQYGMAQTTANTGLSVQQVANQMLSAALGGLGSAGQTYAGIGSIQLANDSALSNALANFAAAAAGGAGYNAATKPAA